LYFSEKLVDNAKEEYESTKMCCFLQYDENSIGNMIKNKIEEDGRRVEWLAKEVCCHRNNIYDIINNRASINTGQLMLISKALNMNFFEYYCGQYDKLVSKTHNTTNCPHCIGILCDL
jgi:hypothetical protein